jgi:hypothetical protein
MSEHRIDRKEDRESDELRASHEEDQRHADYTRYEQYLDDSIEAPDAADEAGWDDHDVDDE